MPDGHKNTEGIDDDLGKLNMSDSDEQLIIAVDFGTTFSGIAYAFTGSGDTEPISVKTWPDEDRTAPKTPTLIHYNADRKKFTWGATVDRINPEVIEGIKLLLDPAQTQPLYIPAEQKTKKLLGILGKLPIDVASDYIAALYNHAINEIENAFFKDYVQMQQKKFVLTVPAVWSDKAKDLTLKAAKNAGIYPITLIKEPEAAALYTLHFLKGKALALGDAFVLCDAGGGTVDLISYEVIGLGPLELKELVPGTGNLAGSLIVNKRFEEFVKDIVGEETFFALRKTKAFATAMKQFDQEVKPNFLAKPEKSWHVNFPMARLPDDPANKLEADCLELTCDSVHQIFEPVINEIEKLVAEQVDKVKVKRLTDNHPKGPDIKLRLAIFLVGGFGASQYLKGRLQKAHPQIQVIQPPNAWGAIVNGGVLSQLPQEASIVSTVARMHYGVSASSNYNEIEDAGQPRRYDKFEGCDRVTKMTWYIERGDDLHRDKKISFGFYRKLDVNHSPRDLIFEDDLLESDDVDPPKYPGTGVKVNVVLRSDFSKVPKSEFKEGLGPGGLRYISVSYKLIIETRAANMEFFAEINGERLGMVTPHYQ